MQPPAEFNDKPPCCCPSEKRIVLVGASVRAAAQSAARAGFCVTGIDLFGDTDTQEACHRLFLVKQEDDVQRIVQACSGVGVMRVGGLSSHDVLIRRLAQASPTLGASELAWDQLRDPQCLHEIAANAEMRFPPTSDRSAALIGGTDDSDGRWLLKQRHSCGGLGVRWHSDHTCVGDGEFLQKWIPGRSYGATLLSDANQVRLLGVCRSLFTRHHHRPFVYAGSMGPIQLAPAVSRSLTRLGEQVAATTKLRGLLNVDFVLDRSGIAWLLEINPRWSGSSELIERRLVDQGRISRQQSLLAFAVHALGCRASLPDLGQPMRQQQTSSDRGATYLKRILFARTKIRFDRSRFESLIGHNESLHDIPQNGTVIGRGDPVFTLITATDHNEVDPVASHRVLLRKIHAAIHRCRLENHSSPRSSAYE